MLDFGDLAEGYVAQYLEERKYKVLERNYRKPWGEIDLVAEKEGILIFVEVKANRNLVEGFEPEIRGNRSKMQRVVRTARTYLLDKKYPEDQPWQIDLVGVVFDKDKGVARIRHFKNIEV